MLEIFQQASRDTSPLQSGTGFWHQLLDRTDSYLETSATAMLAFSIARGVNRGWLPLIYAPVAQTAWKAVEQRIRPDGMVEGIGLRRPRPTTRSTTTTGRRGSTRCRATVPVLLAGAEVITMLRQFDVDNTLNTFHYRPKGRAEDARRSAVMHGTRGLLAGRRAGPPSLLGGRPSSCGAGVCSARRPAARDRPRRRHRDESAGRAAAGRDDRARRGAISSA